MCVCALTLGPGGERREMEASVGGSSKQCIALQAPLTVALFDREHDPSVESPLLQMRKQKSF